MKNNKTFYQCFSWKQKNYIESKGLRYLLKCKHIETDRLMYVFLYDNEGVLDNTLQEWSNKDNI